MILFRYFMYNPDNIFHKMLSGEVEVDVVKSNQFAIAIRDICPAAKQHFLIIPRGSYVSFDDFAQKAPAEEFQQVFALVREVAVYVKIDETGYRLIMNHGADASQTVPHFHIHLLGGEALGGLTHHDKTHG